MPMTVTAPGMMELPSTRESQPPSKSGVRAETTEGQVVSPGVLTSTQR